jgi:hypothetical protein
MRAGCPPKVGGRLALGWLRASSQIHHRAKSLLFSGRAPENLFRTSALEDYRCTLDLFLVRGVVHFSTPFSESIAAFAALTFARVPM